MTVKEVLELARDSMKRNDDLGWSDYTINRINEVLSNSPAVVPLDREKVAGELWIAERGDKCPENEKPMLMEECYRRADFICQRFGTSAVGTGKQVEQKLFDEIIELKKDKRDLDSHLDSIRLELETLKNSLGTKEVDEKKLIEIMNKYLKVSVWLEDQGGTGHGVTSPFIKPKSIEKSAKAISALLRGDV